jgi:hypothetical protein
MVRDKCKCKDLEVTFLFSPAGGFLLLGNNEPFNFFVEDCDADSELEVGTRFETFGVEICGCLVTSGSGFFFVLAISLTLLSGII